MGWVHTVVCGGVLFDHYVLVHGQQAMVTWLILVPALLIISVCAVAYVYNVKQGK